METTKLKNQNFTDFEDITMYLDNVYSDLLEYSNKLDSMFWDLEKEGINGKLLSSLEELIANMNESLKETFKVEEYLYEEIKNVLPEQSSFSALRFENECIARLMDTIKTMIADKGNLKNQVDLLQAEIITASGLIQRNIHKKGTVMLHEARTLIPEDRLNDIVKEIRNNFSLKQA